MENRPSGGGGRGRGRGRALTAQDPPPSSSGSPPSSPPSGLAAPEEPPHAERYAAEVQEPPPSEPQSPQAAALRETFDAMYVAQREGAYPCESDRGRSRGRGAGRGRSEAGRGTGAQGASVMAQVVGPGPGPGVRPAAPSPDKFTDDEQLPGTPPEPAGATPPRPQSSPESVIVEGEGVGEDGETLQQASMQSGRGSTVTTVVQEKPVINRSGTKGEPVPMKTNYMRLKLKPGHRGVVEYHVSIQPSVEDVRTRRQLVGTEQATVVLGQVKSFDGMILFLPHILEKDVTVFTTNLREEPDNQFKITVTFVKVKPMSDCIVFFNMLLNRILRELDYKEIRRQYYDMDMAKTLDQHKLEIWPGTSLCTENQEDGLMICVDTTNRVLRQDTVLDHLNKLKGQGVRAKALFEEFIINKIVITKYNYRCYKIDEVAWDMQPVTKFKHRGKDVNFKEYLKRYPDVKVTDDNQPMLISKLKPRKNEKPVQGEGERLAALVPECCYITGLTEDQKQNFKVMTDLAESTRIVPQQRVVNLDKFINKLLGDEKVRSILGNWGLYIEKDVIEVVGRRMDGPNLVFAKGTKPLLKAPPDFSRESGKGIYEPIPTRRYVVLCTGRDADKAKAFIKCYQQVAQPLGINMLNEGEVVTLKGMNPSHFNEALKQYCPKPDSVHFVVIVMPGARDDIYAAIKRYCIANVPIPSQCIVSKTLGNEKRLRSIVIKIAMQINCKLGGSLWALQMPLKEDIMFIGIDAAHDPLKKDASVMCLVATLNNECTKYFSKSSTSKVHQELADSLQMLTIDALHMFNKHRGKYPDRIIVFRDGGSLGSFEQMETSEAGQMKKAAYETCGDTLKNFTFTVVTKRIPQRFFAQMGRNKIDNPLPGSIVDSIVTRRHYYDFYIVSQQVRQGTVNPTHFVILDSEDPIRPDLIQRFAYVTCFQYFNWSGTVRVPAMVQYAHKLSALLIRHVKAAPHRDISTTLYYL